MSTLIGSTTAMELALVILQKRVHGLTRASLERFVQRSGRALGLTGVANVLVTTSAAVRALNRQFRRQNKATDVLSFPSPLVLAGNGRRRSELAGDIAISADIAKQNAARLGHSLADEIKVLVLHGILHLAGFDHERDNGAMARRELELRQMLKLPTALIERTSSEKTASKNALVYRRRSGTTSHGKKRPRNPRSAS